MDHGKRLHRVFALETTRSKIRNRKSGLLVPTFAETGEGKIENDFERGDEGVVGAFEWLDRDKLIEISSRMLLLAFNL